MSYEVINSIQSAYGDIKSTDIPLIVKEPYKRRVEKLCLVFSILVIVFVYILYFSHRNNKYKKLYKEKLFIHKKSASRIIGVRKFNFYNPSKILDINNIVLLDINNNIIDIDVQHNYFIQKYHIGSGFLYSIDFGKTLLIKEITIIREHYNRDNIIYIDAFNEDDDVIWNYGGLLKEDGRETNIQISI